MVKLIVNLDVLTYAYISAGCVICRLCFLLHDDSNAFFSVKGNWESLYFTLLLHLLFFRTVYNKISLKGSSGMLLKFPLNPFLFHFILWYLVSDFCYTISLFWQIEVYQNIFCSYNLHSCISHRSLPLLYILCIANHCCKKDVPPYFYIWTIHKLPFKISKQWSCEGDRC